MRINEFTDFEVEKENDLGFDVVSDMQVFMKNDPMFYRKKYYPTMCNMQSKLQGGKSPMPTDLTDMITAGAEHYCKQFGINKRPSELLTKEDAKSLAEIIFSEEMTALRDGEY
jgi:hypothetical protein|tara:strand:+ start:188 stop:526 length:339 start_codon:yes stop_codon:yes gene_type:complete